MLNDIDILYYDIVAIEYLDGSIHLSTTEVIKLVLRLKAINRKSIYDHIIEKLIIKLCQVKEQHDTTGKN
jgi:hypothetical protein